MTVPRLAVLAMALAVLAGPAAAADATALIKAAFDNWRAQSSQSTLTMTIHRPTWERHLSMKGWTQGDNEALVRFTAPAKDAGNATLRVPSGTYVFNPKLNQVVKLPASMMSQSWMGSDFSYSDLSKSEDLLKEFTHRITATTASGGHTVYTIEAIPKPGAPVVWGKEVAKIRDDGIFLSVTYYDQDMKPVREMTADRIAPLGGRQYPVVLTMRRADTPGEWTQIVTNTASFNISLPDWLFTRSNLENPREP